jgi:hypothetical protein
MIMKVLLRHFDITSVSDTGETAGVHGRRRELGRSDGAMIKRQPGLYDRHHIGAREPRSIFDMDTRVYSGRTRTRGAGSIFEI